MPTPHGTTPCRATEGGEGGGGGPRLLILSACPPTSHLSSRTWGAFCQADRYLGWQPGNPDLHVLLLLCAAVQRMQHRGAPRPVSAWSALLAMPQPQPTILGREVARAAVASSSSWSSFWSSSSRPWRRLPDRAGQTGRPAGEEEGSLVGGKACVPAGSRQIFYACQWQQDEDARGGKQCRKEDMTDPCEPGQSRQLR